LGGGDFSIKCGGGGNKAKEEFDDIDLLERVVALLPVVRADDRVGREDD
jgi:hypothetical protein